MPEIEDFLGPFHVQFRQRQGTENLERYVTGLLNEHPNKNCETLASVVPGTHPQRLHNLLTDLAWDDANLNRQRVARLLELKTEGCVFQTNPATDSTRKLPPIPVNSATPAEGGSERFRRGMTIDILARFFSPLEEGPNAKTEVIHA